MTNLRLCGTFGAPLPDDTRGRLRFIIVGRAARPLWDSIHATARTTEDPPDPPVRTGVVPCVWRTRAGYFRRTLPSAAAFAAEDPPVLEVYLTAAPGRRGRARYAAALGRAGYEARVEVRVRPYRTDRVAGATVQLVSLAPSV